MNPREFTSTLAGKLIKAGAGEAAYWAFSPNPLPPPIPASWQLTQQLSTADRAMSELAGLGRNLPNPHLFVMPFVRREAVLSSRIEGTRSGVADLYFYEAGQAPLPGMENMIPPSDADLHEVLNYVQALQFGLKRLDTLPVSLRLIREIHERLLTGVRGEYATPGAFRTRQNWIGGATINNAVYVPPPAEEMHLALGLFEKYLHQQDDQYPPLLRLAFLHYQFEAIHPFVDGNGRIGRLLLSLLLVSWKLLPVPLLYLSAYFEKHRQMYYDLLLAVSQTGNWHKWLLFFLRGVEEQSQDTIWRIQRLQALQNEWRRLLADQHASANTIWLLDYLFEKPIITIPQAQKILNVKTYHTARKSLETLLALNIIQPLNDERYDRRFYARDILQVIMENTQE